MALTIQEVKTGYSKKQVLQGVSLSIEHGEIMAIIGPNGCGKTTTLKAIAGTLPCWAGSVKIDGWECQNIGPAQRMRHGLAFCPQGNRVFGSLTVRDNIDVGGRGLTRKVLANRRESVIELFPVLGNRQADLAGVLSGGEQQMLSLARALMGRPKYLMLDEPSLGLSPALLDDVFLRIEQIRKEANVGILVVEQKVRRVLNLADSVVALRLGKVAYAAQAADLQYNEAELKRIFL